MLPDTRESRRTDGVRLGLTMLATAVVLSPLIAIVERLLPSRENTVVDELPAMVLSVVLAGLAVAGVVRVGYALVSARGKWDLSAPHELSSLDRPQQRKQADQLVAPRNFDTPV